MRLTLLVMYLASALAAQDLKPEDACTLSGKVTNAATGEAISRVRLTLRRTDPPRPGAPSAAPPSYTTTTDASGAYAMKDLPPGVYRLAADRNGFASMEFGARTPGRAGAPLTLTPGQRMTSADLKLTSHSVIAGRIFDEAGEPARAEVTAMRYQVSQGRRQLVMVNRATTNDLGDYRIFGLPPGRYYIVAKDMSPSGSGSEDRSAGGAAVEGYIPTFYPGSSDAQTAAMVDATGGRQVLGVDLKLARARLVRLRVKVINQTGVNSTIIATLIPREQLGILRHAAAFPGSTGLSRIPQFDARPVPAQCFRSQRGQHR